MCLVWKIVGFDKHSKPCPKHLGSFRRQNFAIFLALGSTHIVRQILFSIFSSILTFDMVLDLWLFLLFSPNGLFFHRGNFQNLFCGLIIKLKNSYCLCFLQIYFFVFNLIGLCFFFHFWDLNGLF